MPDFERLKAILASPAGASLPAALRSKMEHDVAEYERQKLMTAPAETTAVTGAVPSATRAIPAQVDMSTRPDATNVTNPQQQAGNYQRGVMNAQGQSYADAMLAAIPKAAFQFTHDMTLGLTPSPYSQDPLLKDTKLTALEPITRITSGFASIMLQGSGLLKGLSYVGKVPLITRGLEFIPSRLKEIGLGAIINGGIDALRADGLARNADGTVSEQSWMDPSAKMAKPLVELGVPERLALGLGGGAVGAILGPAIMGMASGYQSGRSAYIAARMTPELETSIRDGLTRAGVDLSQTGTKYDLAKTFIKNARKIAMKEPEAGIMADQLSREQYIADEMTQAVENPKLEVVTGSAVRDAKGMVYSEKLDYQAWEKATAAGADVKETGFVTSEGRFINVKEAEALARDTGQLEPGTKFAMENLGNAQVEVDSRLIAGIFRNNPGGINVVRGVSAAAARSVQVAQERLGVGLHWVAIPKEDGLVDVLLARPAYEYPAVGVKGNINALTKKVNDRIRTMAREAATSVTAPKTTEAFILADGEPVRGGLNMARVTESMKLQRPVVGGVERPDLALREAGRMVRLDIPAEGKLTIELPRTLTQEQFRAIGNTVDAMKFEEVTIKAMDGTEQILKTPIGGRVQDQVAKMVKPSKVGSTITPKMVDQFKRTGVFEGQAVVLPDGTAAEIVSKHGAAGYKVKDTMTGQVSVIHPRNLTILPTNLASEFQPSNLFTSGLPDLERNALAKLRNAITQGWAKPIKKFRDLESFANTRGYVANDLRGGKVELVKLNEGGAEPMRFDNLKAATEWIRKDTGPVAELANAEVTKLLGPDRNLGYIGGGGPPPRFGELLTVDWKRMEQTMETLPTGRTVGFFEELRKPLMPLLRDLDSRFGTQMYKAFFNLQSQQIAKQNFEGAWFHGRGKLPPGVKGLKEIIEIAGKDADRELIFNWREADAGAKVAIEKEMTAGELKAGKELGKWFDAMYPAIGVDAPFVENYMPRYREWLQKGGTDFNAFLKASGLDPLKPPPGADFIGDHVRNGLLDVYNKDPFKVALQYLQMGSKNRFMKQAQNEAREMIRLIGTKNESLALPFARAVEAMGGYEFAEQRAMLQETFTSFMDKLPHGTAVQKSNLADRMVNFFSGAVYSSTMGFRPSLALRNAKDIFVMAYPLYGGPRFFEALGHSLTAEGRAEAMAARAIGQKGGMLTETVEEFASELPETLRRISDASTRLYEDADAFTRSGTYHAAKVMADDAIAMFGKKVAGVTDARKLAGLKADLLRDSKVYLHGKDIEDEFLRLAGTSPDRAAQLAGKVAADMTNFLYGRGMQARWMRSTGGRFLGQFGSWSMWYMDYLTRLTRAVAKGPNRADAAGMLARHALVNAAIVMTGKQVLDVDLSRWASYGAIFYSGGPGMTVATGAMTLWRGLGEQSSLGEDPLAQTRVKEGSSVIWHTLPSFVPFYYAGQDVLRMAHSYDNTEMLAATLGTRPTKAYIERRRLEIALGDYIPPFQTTSGALSAHLNSQVEDTGQTPVDIREVPHGAVASQGGMQIPSGAGVARPGMSTGNSKPQSALPSLAGAPTTVPATTAYSRRTSESTRPATSKPPEGY